MENQFNTDTKALGIREDLNQTAAYNLEDWMLGFMQPFADMSVLDIGCGRGKQVFYYQKFISPAGKIVGIDASQEAVDIVNQRAEENNFNNVSATCALIDEVPELFAGKKFDRIISSYAIYYSDHLVELLIDLKALLNPGGLVLICGYGKNSNEEIINMINSHRENNPLPQTDDFISEEDLKTVAAHYRQNKTYTLNNRITFNSAEDVLAWWRNHNTFVPDLNDAIAKELNEHFRLNETFLLAKNVLAIQLEA